MSDDDYSALRELVREQLTERNFIEMVKFARMSSGGNWGLPDAKDFVERIRREKFGV